MALHIRSRASRRKSQAQAYAAADPGRSKAARVGTAVLIALAALWQAFVLRQAQSAESGDETAAQSEMPIDPETVALPDLPAYPVAEAAQAGTEPAGATRPVTPGILTVEGTVTAPDGPPTSGGGGTLGGGDASLLSRPNPMGPIAPGGRSPADPLPVGGAPGEPAPETAGPAAPGEGPVPAAPLPYGLEELLADLTQILPQSAGQAAFLGLAVDDWLSAARLDSLRRGAETEAGAPDWEAYARDRQQVAALENPTARDAYLAQFLPGGVEAAAADLPADPAPAPVDPFVTEPT